MRILICGDRYWANKELIRDTVENYVKTIKLDKIYIIEGEANGADSLAREVAEELGLEVMKFPADWSKYHRAAGPIRNQQMLQQGKPDMVLAFHNNLSQSKGTADMVKRARKAGVPTEVISE